MTCNTNNLRHSPVYAGIPMGRTGDLNGKQGILTNFQYQLILINNPERCMTHIIRGRGLI